MWSSVKGMGLGHLKPAKYLDFISFGKPTSI
jgi:hypothetical protein